MAQLTEAMRRKDGKTFIGLLINIRVGECSKDSMTQIYMRKINFNSVPRDVTVIFTE